MKKAKIFLSVFLCLIFLCSLGFSNGLNLNGIGARAIAMGGAFVGLADDFSAVFWNPAGLGQLKGTNFGLTGDLVFPKGSYQTSMPNEIYPFYPDPTLDVDATLPSRMYPAGLAGIYSAFGDYLVAGLGVYTPAGLGAKWEGTDFAEVSGAPGFPNQNILWESFVGVITFSPALAVNIQDRFFFGATLNVNYGMFNIARTAGWTPLFIIPIDMGQYEESSTGWGFGATVGLLVKPIDQLSFGVSFRTPTVINFKGEAKLGEYANVAGTPLDLETDLLPSLSVPPESDFERAVTFPMWLGIGVAFHPLDSVTITADAQYTNWKNLSTIETDYDDLIWQIFLEEESAMELDWMDKWQLRFGFEFWIGDNFALRAGYYNDPTPVPDETMNVLLPSFSFNSFSAGFGYVMNGLAIDLAVEYLMGKERDIEYMNLGSSYPLELKYESPGVYNMDVLAVNLSISYGNKR